MILGLDFTEYDRVAKDWNCCGELYLHQNHKPPMYAATHGSRLVMPICSTNCSESFNYIITGVITSPYPNNDTYEQYFLSTDKIQ